MITNWHLLKENKKNKNDDKFCLCVRIRQNENKLLILEVLKNDPAPLIDFNQHPDEFNISHIRDGKYPDLFLLSGGLLVFEKNNLALAMGERNDKSSDPFCWTNIVAGRCDNYWRQHILNELAEEFFLLLEQNGQSFTSLIPGVLEHPENVLNFQKLIIPQISNYKTLNFSIDNRGDFLDLNKKSFWKKVQIYWPDKVDEFEAVVYFDEKNHTFEIRQPALTDLTGFSKLNLLFPEGANEADWFPVSDLKYQRQKEQLDFLNQKQRFVPFMQFFLDHV